MSILHKQTDDKSNWVMGTSSVAPSTVKGSKLLNADFEQACSFLSLENEYPETKGMDNAAKREFAAEKQKDIQRRLVRSRQKLANLRDEAKRNDFMSEYMRTLGDWFDSEAKIERPTAPHFRDLRRSVADGDVVYINGEIEAEVPSLEYEKEVFRFAQVMVVEHDWASAFANANMNDSPVRLPYDLCAFEFQYGGVPVIVFATQIGDEIFICNFYKWQGKWAVPSDCQPMNMTDAAGDMSKQIRAVCIALDAQIAYSEVRREPHTGPQVRNTLPLRDYNVVSLVSRKKAIPAASNPSGKRVRLHFRRGHWRHLDGHKTWIKWMLVGDPDLGFVDKHYRL